MKRTPAEIDKALSGAELLTAHGGAGTVGPKRSPSRRAAAAVTLAVVIAVAGVAVALVIVRPGGRGGSTASSVEATSSTALQSVETALAESTPLNWTVFSVVGIASESAFTPEILSLNETFESDLAAMWGCESLPFPSLWNVSGLPVDPGNLTDGYAPFWQFLLENGSGSGPVTYAVGVYVAGAVRVTAPLTTTDPCIQGLGLSQLTSEVPEAEPSLSSSVAAPLAYEAITATGSQLGRYAVLWGDGWPVLSTDGWGGFSIGYGDGWSVTYYDCDQAGVGPPSSPIVAWQAGVAPGNGTPEVGGVVATGSICTLSEYNVTLGATHVSPVGGGSTYRGYLNVSGSYHGLYGNESDVPSVQGLAAWMVRPAVDSPDGGSIPASADLCSSWSPLATSCPIPSGGWYAVLESPDGAWLDSYGSVNGVTGWAASNVPIVSGESLVVVGSSSTLGSNDTLTLDPTGSGPQIQSNAPEL